MGDCPRGCSQRIEDRRPSSAPHQSALRERSRTCDNAAAMKADSAHRLAAATGLLLSMGCQRTTSTQQPIGGERLAADAAHRSQFDRGTGSACNELRGVATELDYAQRTVAKET